MSWNNNKKKAGKLVALAVPGDQGYAPCDPLPSYMIHEQVVDSLELLARKPDAFGLDRLGRLAPCGGTEEEKKNGDSPPGLKQLGHRRAP